MCRAKVKSVQINHSMRNMLVTYLKQYPTRNRDPASLLDLDAAGVLTDEMIREGKLKSSSQGSYYFTLRRSHCIPLCYSVVHGMFQSRPAIANCRSQGAENENDEDEEEADEYGFAVLWL